MRRYTQYYSALCLGVLLIMCLASLVWAQNRMHSKIGLRKKSGNSIAWAQTKDHITAGDFLRVYVIPDTDAYIYLVYTDGKTPRLLNSATYKTKRAKGVPAVFPAESEGEFYQTDGKNPTESFTIICSPAELPEIPALLNAPRVSHEQWTRLEKTLTQRSKIDLSDKTDKPFPIAGNTRELGGVEKELPTISGESFVMKKYELALNK
jgi:hypothetical protein